MPKERDLEVRVGTFVVIAIVCLVAFIFSISDFSIFKKGETYRVTFHYANGLKKGAPVRLAGVDAGHVKSIRIAGAGTPSMAVLIDIWMGEGFNIPGDSRFLINQLGLLGEKYLEILPGVSPQMVAPGTPLTGEDPVPMESITKTMGSLGAKVETTIDGINNGILSQANRAALAATLANMAAVSANIRNGEGTVGKFLLDPSVFRNLDELSADLKANPWKLFYRPKKASQP